jgi:hypothetical protein
MPKSKKPAGGRAQNFEPRYGAKTSYQDAKRRPGQSSAGKPGSKSPSHRGYRAAEAPTRHPRRSSAGARRARRPRRGPRHPFAAPTASACVVTTATASAPRATIAGSVRR